MNGFKLLVSAASSIYNQAEEEEDVEVDKPGACQRPSWREAWHALPLAVFISARVNSSAPIS